MCRSLPADHIVTHSRKNEIRYLPAVLCRCAADCSQARAVHKPAEADMHQVSFLSHFFCHGHKRQNYTQKKNKQIRFQAGCHVSYTSCSLLYKGFSAHTVHTQTQISLTPCRHKNIPWPQDLLQRYVRIGTAHSTLT